MPAPNAIAAVFLSYSRDDLDSVRRIADALCAAGIEVWFDQSELRGGDTWDAKIKTQIRECALFLAVISAQTQARREGYFRREWNLAVERTLDMAHGTPFLLPVVVDDTREAAALVPEQFMRVQWTRLPSGAVTLEFAAQVKRLLGSENAVAGSVVGAPLVGARGRGPATPLREPSHSWSGPMKVAVALGATVLALIAFVVLRPANKEVPVGASAKLVSESKTAAPAAVAPAVPFAPGKSIAVLPFENMSPDKDNAFFADGVHEDVITNLGKIRDLKVIGRTSVLQFRDPATRNHKQIAADLGVATLLEGSVRRAGTKVRVTAQLINARTGESLWADTYDVDLTDAFTIQSALAQQITAALKANFTTGERAFIAERPTQNQEAYDLFLRARTLFGGGDGLYLKTITEQAIALYEQAVAKDPAFVGAYAQLAYLNGRMYWFGFMDPTPARRERAKAALDAAVRLAPDKPETRLARGAYAYYCENNWTRALAEYRAAAAVLPNDAQLIFLIGLCHRRLGAHQDAAVYFARSMELSPHEIEVAVAQLETLHGLRRYAELSDLGARYVAVFPNDRRIAVYLRGARLELGHDVAAFLQGMDASLAWSDDPSGLTGPYNFAMRSGDLAAAERILADPRLTVLPGAQNATADPVALHRAMVAFLRGQREAARAFADEAIVYYRARTWTSRQTGAVMIATALAHALAGRGDEAVKLTREGYAWQVEHDRLLLAAEQAVMQRTYLVLDRRDDAFAVLRETMTSPSPRGPEETRLDPFWRRVKDDPRFEEILKLAKPL